jgi:hypothetical protein
MGKVYERIDGRLAEFIARQRVFFVATAPLADTGLLNLSPKGLDTFAILGPREVAYLDFHGSGIETVAHLRENGRIVLMFCAFEGPPNIVRLHGRGAALEPGDPGFAELRERFPAGHEHVRTLVRVSVERIADSCGYAVPRFRYEGERDQLVQWASKQGADGVRRYAAEHNRESLDGLPGLRRV